MTVVRSLLELSYLTGIAGKLTVPDHRKPRQDALGVNRLVPMRSGHLGKASNVFSPNVVRNQTLVMKLNPMSKRPVARVDVICLPAAVLCKPLLKHFPPRLGKWTQIRLLHS